MSKIHIGSIYKYTEVNISLLPFNPNTSYVTLPNIIACIIVTCIHLIFAQRLHILDKGLGLIHVCVPIVTYRVFGT